MMKKICYPAICFYEDGQFQADFPDLDGCQTWGAESTTEIVEYAKEALSGYTASLIERNIPLPEPTPIEKLTAKGVASFIAVIEADLSSVGKTTKKTLTIPRWLNDEATKRGLNFSQVLRNALIDELTA
jgi:predicted RNase H-like HicB family nuclease